jgi:hypothetical protein
MENLNAVISARAEPSPSFLNHTTDWIPAFTGTTKSNLVTVFHCRIDRNAIRVFTSQQRKQAVLLLNIKHRAAIKRLT